jgi:hypothetical protein
VDAVTAPGPAGTVAAQRARLAELDAVLSRLRERYDLLMNAFKFDAAKAIHARIEAAERERGALARAVPPQPTEPPPAPYAVAGRRRRRR